MPQNETLHSRSVPGDAVERARARERAQQIVVRADQAAQADMRLLHVVRLIANGEFVPGVTPQQLSREWGVGVNTVREVVAKASQYIRLDRVGIQEQIEQRLAAILHDRELASQRTRPIQYQGHVLETHPDPDVPSMLRAEELYLQAMGALVRSRGVHEVLGGAAEDGIDMVAIVREELRANPAFAEVVLRRLHEAPVPAAVDMLRRIVDAFDVLCDSNVVREVEALGALGELVDEARGVVDSASASVVVAPKEDNT